MDYSCAEQRERNKEEGERPVLFFWNALHSLFVRYLLIFVSTEDGIIFKPHIHSQICGRARVKHFCLFIFIKINSSSNDNNSTTITIRYILVIEYGYVVVIIIVGIVTILPVSLRPSNAVIYEDRAVSSYHKFNTP